MDREAWQAAVLGVTGQRSLAGCSPWGHKELDTTQHTHTHTHTHCHVLHMEYNYVIYRASYLSVIAYYPMFHSDN